MALKNEIWKKKLLLSPFSHPTNPRRVTVTFHFTPGFNYYRDYIRSNVSGGSFRTRGPGTEPNGRTFTQINILTRFAEKAGDSIRLFALCTLNWVATADSPIAGVNHFYGYYVPDFFAGASTPAREITCLEPIYMKGVIGRGFCSSNGLCWFLFEFYFPFCDWVTPYLQIDY